MPALVDSRWARFAAPAGLPAVEPTGAEDSEPTTQVPKHRSSQQRDQQDSRRLFRGCIVSRFGVHVQRRQAFRRIQLHLDLPPLAIACWIGWTVSEHILVAQLDANLCRHVRQFVRRLPMVNVRPPVTSVTSVSKRGPFALFWRLEATGQTGRCHKSGRRLPAPST